MIYFTWFETVTGRSRLDHNAGWLLRRFAESTNLWMQRLYPSSSAI